MALVVGLGFWFKQRTHDYRQDYNHSLAAYEQGDLALALKLMQKAYQGQPTHADTVYNLATLLLENDEPTQAYPLFQQAITLNPSDANIHFNLAVCLLLNQQAGQALDQLEEGIELLATQGHTPDADWYHLLASAHVKLGQRPEALQTIKQALAQSPQHSAALLLKGQLHLGQQQLADALTCFEAVAHLTEASEDDVATAHFYSAYCHLGLGQWPSVLLTLESATLPPLWQAKAANLVGLAHWHQGDYAAAQTSFQAALAAQPTQLSSQWHVALATVALGQAEEGQALLENALEHPDLSPHEKDEWLLQWQSLQQHLLSQPVLADQTPHQQQAEPGPESADQRVATPQAVVYSPDTDHDSTVDA
jgi:tetratricopeptide (TPR) repeat protein